MKGALIPDDFQDARLDNYQIHTEIQRKLFQMTQSYLKAFEKIKDSKVNSLGFIAEVGEKQIKRVPDPRKRAELGMKYNSYGLGKTHLQIAAAKELIRRGYAVLCISDTTFMDDVMNARMAGDGGVESEKLINAAIEAPILVWDDIGKSRYSEAKESVYYRIINERSRARRPILFSSNEDEITLSDHINGAAFSRLHGMAKDYFLKVKGDDFRMEAI